MNPGNIIPVVTDIDINQTKAAATGVLTSDESQPAAGDKVVIGTREYDFVSALHTQVKSTGTITSDGQNPDAGGTFEIGDKEYTLVAALTEAYAAGILTSDNTNPSVGDTVTIGLRVYTFDDDFAAAKATGTIDMGATGPSDGDTIVIGTQTLMFKTTLSTGPTVPNEVLIEADVDDTLQNLKDAVNTGAVADKVSEGTVANTTVDAGEINTTDHTLALAAKIAGAAGNSIVLTESATDTTVTGSGTLTGGDDAEAANVIKIGVDADTTLGNLKAAINGEAGEGTKFSTGTAVHADVTCGEIAAHAMTITAKALGVGGNAIAKAESSAHLDWDGTGAYLTGGVDAIENEILIGGSAAATLDNIKSAINATAGEGTVYSTGTTANGEVEATTNGDTTQVVQSLTYGEAGNDIVMTENATHLTVTGMDGGIDADEGDQVLIGADADSTLQALVDLINEGRAAVAASGVLTSTNTNPADADEVALGDETYVFKTNLTEVKASGVLTSDQTNVSDGDTVTIGTKVYTFKSSLTSQEPKSRAIKHADPYSVLIGEDADTSLGNLVAAINGDTGEGEKYAYNTPAHPDVTAGAVTSHATTVTAVVAGTAGNAIAKAETSSHLDWDGSGSVLTGGIAGVANEVKIGANANTTLANLKAAINGATGEGSLYGTGTVANADVEAGAIDTGAHTLTVEARVAGMAGNSLTKTETGSQLDWDGSGAVLTGGLDAVTAHADVTAGDVAAHATTVTAKVAGFAGNSIAKSEDSAHLDWDGSGAYLTGGGGTVGIHTIADGGGFAHRFLFTIPQFTGTPTFALALYNEDDVLVKTFQASQAENALSDNAYETTLRDGDYIKVTASTAVEDSAKPVVLEIR